MGIAYFTLLLLEPHVPPFITVCKQGPPCIMASAFITVEHGERKQHPWHWWGGLCWIPQATTAPEDPVDAGSSANSVDRFLTVSRYS